MTMQSARDEPEPGYALSLGLIATLAALLFACLTVGVKPSRPPSAGLGTILGGFYLIAWGLMFLASYYFSHKSFFLRALRWVCVHFSFPADPKMAFFYFGLASVMGSVLILYGFGVL